MPLSAIEHIYQNEEVVHLQASQEHQTRSLQTNQEGLTTSETKGHRESQTPGVAHLKPSLSEKSALDENR